MRRRARPPLESVEVLPVLPHAGMRRKEREPDVFVKKQAVRLGFDRSRDLRAEPQKCLESGEGIDPHAEINDHKVGICAQVHGASVNSSHVPLPHLPSGDVDSVLWNMALASRKPGFSRGA